MSFSKDDYLLLSGIQHFYFCKKQWALIHISQAWEENADTMLGRIVHERTDDPFLNEKRGDILISRAIQVSSSKLGMTGVLDTVEFRKDDEGVSISGRQGKWKPAIVEYKKGKAKADDRDKVQLVAQVICLEEELSTKIYNSYLYYYSVKKREDVEITNDLRIQTQKLADEMHTMHRLGKIPKAELSQKCYRCSLFDVCMPQVRTDKADLVKYLQEGFIK